MNQARGRLISLHKPVCSKENCQVAERQFSSHLLVLLHVLTDSSTRVETPVACELPWSSCALRHPHGLAPAPLPPSSALPLHCAPSHSAFWLAQCARPARCRATRRRGRSSRAPLPRAEPLPHPPAPTPAARCQVAFHSGTTDEARHSWPQAEWTAALLGTSMSRKPQVPSGAMQPVQRRRTPSPSPPESSVIACEFLLTRFLCWTLVAAVA
mmetsp:Transcript_15383/g.28928  ORF Transcript_15383/g.28928 Transcript_15383/m.28928 type:complete len:212 (-) Transcript_15383:81-716(-)